jgi:hypothetical protein
MTTFNFDTIKETLNPAKFIDQAEKNTKAILAYVQPAELSKTLVNLTSDTSDFVRAQFVAFDNVTTIVKKQAEEAVNSFTKVIK